VVKVAASTNAKNVGAKKLLAAKDANKKRTDTNGVVRNRMGNPIYTAKK
jgi:hypothetical protein